MDKATIETKTHDDYTVGWVCALSKEQTAATAMLDKIHGDLSKPANDSNTYTLGSIGEHNVVIACLPQYGTNAAATVATQMVRTFPSIKIGLMVGIGGGIPPKVRLGDVVVSTPSRAFPGVVQWDMGKAKQAGFERVGALNSPPSALLTALTKLRTQYEMYGSKIPEHLERLKSAYPRLAQKYMRSDSLQDVLFRAHYSHVEKSSIYDGESVMTNDEIEDEKDEEEEDSCRYCDKTKIVKRTPREMRVHHGLIASGNQVIKDATLRDLLNKDLGGQVLCVEMEAAGLMNNFPCVVIRGICDYADSHKDKCWQEHAAAVAAAFAKELLGCLQSSHVEGERMAKDILNEFEQVKQGLQDVHKQVRDGFVSTGDTLAELIKEKELQDRLAILDWLTIIDHSPQQNDYITKREPGTGRWLLDSSELKFWLETNKQTLFCPGLPGAGKTIQTSILVQDLLDKFEGRSTVGVAYLYCNFRRQADQTPELLVLNILKQLSQHQKYLPDSVKRLYKRHKNRRTRPQLDEISTVTQSVVSLYSRVYVVIDALDECEEADGNRTKLINELFNLQSTSGINLFATSRLLPEIMKRFQGYTSIEIQPSHEDIWNYLDKRMGQLPDFVAASPDLQIEVKTEIEAAIEGIFLLARLYLDSLVGKRSPAAIRKALKGLRKASKLTHDGSSALHEAYEKAIERIQRQRGDLPRDAMLIFSWIVNAKRQLTVPELQHALAVEIGRDALDEADIPSVGHMTRACAPLITVDEESNIIRLVHYTAQEYFETTQHRWFPEAKDQIARISLTYLSFMVFDSGHCPSGREFKQRLDTNKFYDYVAKHWGHHVREAAIPCKEIIDFLMVNTKLDAAAQGLLEPRKQSDFIQHFRSNMTGLHLAAYFGLKDVVSAFIKMGYDPDSRDSKDETPLWWACRNGHEGTVQLLIKENVNLNAFDSHSKQNCLSWAATNGHVEVVKLLLDENVDPDSRDGGFRTPTWWASTNGHLLVLKLLLERNVDIESMDDMSKLTPLSSASRRGEEAVVRMLIGKGADIEARDKWGLTPLAWASRNGNGPIVTFLINKGANVNARDDSGTSILHWVAWTGHEAILSQLLENGAETETANLGAGTALAAAIEKSSGAIVQLLLAKGAQSNYHYKLFQRRIVRNSENALEGKEGYVVLDGYRWGNPGWVDRIERWYSNAQLDKRSSRDLIIEYFVTREVTPLWRAAERNDEAVVKLLKARVAPLIVGEARHSSTRSPLQWAATHGHELLMGLLLEQDIEKCDIEKWNKKDERGLTPISAAAKNGQEAVIQLLLAHNEIEADSRDNKGRSALSHAAEHGSDKVVELLLKAGKTVNVNSKDTAGLSALAYSARSGHAQVVRLLLACGNIEADSKDDSGNTPLSLAAQHGEYDVVELLITAHKTDINSTDNQGRTPLLLASLHGHVDVVGLLLRHGASRDAEDREGQNALTSAKQRLETLRNAEYQYQYPWQIDKYEAVVQLLTPDFEQFLVTAEEEASHSTSRKRLRSESPIESPAYEFADGS